MADIKAKKVIFKNKDGEYLLPMTEDKTGLVLFDTVIKDHVLSYEESKGLALQGTYVYKQAIAGSRYGYADFYAKVIEEYNQATSTETVNGVTVKVHSNGHKFYDIANKTGIDEFFNTIGSAWFYGVDIANERILLPRDNYFAVKGSVGVAGNGMALGFTDGTNTAGMYLRNLTNLGGSATPMLSKIAYGETLGINYGKDNDTTWGTPYTTAGITTDATKSGIEGKLTSNTDKYLYICVGNTESQSSITDVVDITTTENDTVPLFTGLYFDFTPNNASWLKGGQQTNNAGIYKTCYNELVNVLNGSTKYGDLKVVDTAKMTAGVDYSEYWKVNQTNMTFTTPTKISYLPINGDTAPVIGNGMSLGLTDGTQNSGVNFGMYQGGSLGLTKVNYGRPVGEVGAYGAPSQSYASAGVTTDPTKSGLIADLAGAKSQTSQLYFKVANAVQNLELLDVGEVMEAVADKISRQDCKAYIIETYVNGTSGYNVWSNGYCEQWGQTAFGQGDVTVSLVKTYTNTSYNITTANVFTSYGYRSVVKTNSVAVNQFVINRENGNMSVYWKTCGYIA